MSHTQAIIALTSLSVLFVLNLLDYLVGAYSGIIPEPVTRTVSAILVGVAIIMIVQGVRNGRNGSGGSPEGGAGSAEDVGRRRGRTEMTDSMEGEGVDEQER